MSVEAQSDPDQARARPAPGRGHRLAQRAARLGRAIGRRFSSSLTRRIVVLNLGGLVALFLGFLYLNQFREGLIDARVQSLQTQGEIIAAAIAASATVDTDLLTIDPEKLLQLAPGESLGASPDASGALEFSINPERIGPVLRRLVSPTRTRARVYDTEGFLLVDSRSLTTRGNILRYDLPAPQGEDRSAFERGWTSFRQLFQRRRVPEQEEAAPGDGKDFPEVVGALAGVTRSIVRVNASGDTIVSVAVPVQRFRVVRGALLLSTQGDDIDKIIATERWAILRIFLVSAGVMLVLSLFLAGTIAEPMRRLAEAADRVRRGVKSRQEIPDFTNRADEIGHLSGALRDMTQALYKRIEAIESFAADVAHELKNPLTSLRSAVETLPRVKKEDARERLLAIIQHDVKRLDRLISDISDASRLDAELARGDSAPIDLAVLLEAAIHAAQEAPRNDGVRIVLAVAPAPPGAYRALGHDSRLGQVINNLVDNARSFSAQGGEVRVSLRRREPGAEDEGAATPIVIAVEDDGPGIPDHALERIFERFYTDRPTQNFGQNSGLGLSISRQIVEAHGGAIVAENRRGASGAAVGARFTISLPAAPA